MKEYKGEDQKQLVESLRFLIMKCLNSNLAEMSCVVSFNEEAYVDCKFEFKIKSKEQVENEYM